MRNDIDGVAFDLDGTLYPNYRFFIRLTPFILKEHALLLALGKARDDLRAAAEGKPAEESGLQQPAFYDLQAQFMAKILHKEAEAVKERTERLIYRGWEPLFKKIRPYPLVRETLRALRERGFKLGMLSDFPPETKLKNMDLAGFWDVELCSEVSGYLKPHPAPFLELANRLGIPPERLLYVGNSVRYDIIGAKKTGMRAALISSPFCTGRRRNGNADFIFSHYRQLRDYMLG
ncbi:MAG: HAD family hydrolase [Treponema sp.]|jgi:putative hydrolase of the HAD superfamily|nr:HAD family hydrolase [Treponema sp.]